ncbi:MAG: phage tail tape measure protein [Melioribacteraceae bacterium]|jgi:TP901 family phage tail tape measure protein|nr:phage tail tape measure protein [Melioribacteraceae bacterium]
MANIGSLYAYIGADTTGLSLAQKQVSSFVTGTTSKFNSIISVAGKVSAAFAAIGVGGVFLKTIPLLKEYESALVDMGKVSSRSFSDIHKDISSFSSELGNSIELVKGYYEAMSAGVTEASESFELITTASKLAKASHIDQATTIKTLAVMMGAYGEELKTTANAASLLLNVENVGITTTAELAGVIGSVANLAKQAGLSANELGAAIAQISTSGIGTAETVTQLRSVITALIKNFDDLPASIKKYESVSEAVKNLGFIGVLQEMVKQTNGNETALVDLLGRQEAYLALLQLTKNESVSYNKMVGFMTESADSLTVAWNNYKNSLEGLWGTLKNKVTNEFINFGMKILPTIKTGLQVLVENIDKLISAFTTLSKILVGLGFIYFAKTVIPLIILGVQSLVAEIQLMNVRLALAPGLVGKLTTSLTGTSVAAQVASKQMSLLSVSVNALFAGFAGWQIGKWLSANFEEARLAGVMFVDYTIKGWNLFEYAVKSVIAAVKNIFEQWIYSAKILYGGFLLFIADGIKNLPGLKEKGEELTGYANNYLKSLQAPKDVVTTLQEITAEYEKTKKQHDEIITDMVTAALDSNQTKEIENIGKQLIENNEKIKNSAGNVKQSTVESLQAYQKMYEDMGYYGKEWYDNEVALLTKQAEDYKALTGDKLAAEKWLQDQIVKLKSPTDISKIEDIEKSKVAYENLISSIDPVIARSLEMAEAQKIIQQSLELGIITSGMAVEANKKLTESYENEAADKLLQDKMSLYKDLEGFEDEYRQTQLEWIEKIRKEEIKATGKIVAANRKASEQIAKIKQAEFESQAMKVDDALGQMAAAFQSIGNMYDKSSGEYAKMQSAAKAMIVLQQAVAVATAVAAIANQGLGDPYTAFARIAAMAAAMAGLLASTGMSLGGGSSAAAQTKPKSTVLGAEDGKGSESIMNSYKLLEDTYSMEYQELSKLNDSMKELNNNISGLVANVLRVNIGNLGGANSKEFGTSYDIGKMVDKMLSYPLAIMTGGIFGGILNNFLTKITGDWLGKAFNSVFGGKVTTSVTESGLSLGGSSVSSLSSGSEVAAQAYALIKKVKDGGWFSSDRTSFSTQYQSVSAGTQDLISSIYQNLSESLLTLTQEFGMDMSKTLAYTFSSININLKGLSGEEVNKKLSEYFSELGDKAVETLFGSILSGYQQVGEGLLETAVRLIRDKAIIVDTLEMTGQAFTGTIPQLISFSEALISIAGDIDKLRESAEKYYDKFFTDEEKHIRLQKQLTEALSDINFVLPETRKGYRDLVEGIDLTTESGKKAYVSLLQWSEYADEFYSALEDSVTDAADATKNLVNQLLDYITTIDDFITSMKLSSEFAPSISYEQIQGQFSKLYQGALTGEQEALNKLINYTQQTYLPFIKAYDADSYQKVFDDLFGANGTFSSLKEQVTNSLLEPYEIDYTDILSMLNGSVIDGAQAIIDSINLQTSLINKESEESVQKQQEKLTASQEQLAANEAAVKTYREALAAYNAQLVVVEQIQDYMQDLYTQYTNSGQNNTSFGAISLQFQMQLEAAIAEANRLYGLLPGLPGHASGGTITRDMITRVGEKGTEWIVPSYQPESNKFLKSVGVDSNIIAELISSKMNSGSQHVTVQIDGKSLMDIIIENGKSDYSFSKGMREIVNG